MKLTMEKFFHDVNGIVPAILIGGIGTIVRFLYDGYIDKDFALSKLLISFCISALVIWTVSHLMAILNYNFDVRIQQLIYCWTGYTSRDLVFIFSKKFVNMVNKNVSDEGENDDTT